jgi:organic radical activating enzyme|tara:strand:+ start:2830 stop:3951 length:1122 start_codon:yes stop_codon:yes gene_type:complete
MPKISKTFCPSKWDDLHLNFNYNRAYACCKASPINFVSDWSKELDRQKENLLSDTQDPSCNYCWDIENQGGVSDRNAFMSTFDNTTYKEYVNNRQPKNIEVNLGNECNFQCTYCGPTFSSKWEGDISKKHYEFKTDLHHYKIEPKSKENKENNLDFLKQYDRIELLNVIGGEPLQNKNLFKLLDSVDNVDTLSITTNLSCSQKKLDKILQLSKKYKKLRLGISIDSTDKIGEFTRLGLDFTQWKDNVDYILDNMADNVEIIFLTLFTSLTIKDIANTIELITGYCGRTDSATWRLSYCVSPKIQGFATVPEEEKIPYLITLNTLRSQPFIKNVDSIIESLIVHRFDKKLYDELQEFLQEFSQRKNIKIPYEFL